jgi:hypothetical protein
MLRHAIAVVGSEPICSGWRNASVDDVFDCWVIRQQSVVTLALQPAVACVFVCVSCVFVIMFVSDGKGKGPCPDQVCVFNMARTGSATHVVIRGICCRVLVVFTAGSQLLVLMKYW